MYLVNRTTILSSIVVILLLFGCVIPAALGQYDQLTIVQDGQPQPQIPQVPQASSATGAAGPLATVSGRAPQQEIFVQPNSRVRIECKLPQIDNSPARKYYWNFQRSALQDNKPDLLCYQMSCVDESAHGIQLEIDQSTGAYDLLISNATYELNDGIYYCDYKDTSPESRTTINREFRLTVLIPPQAPSIAALSLAPAREGQEHQLNCVSAGGNPEPNITWFRNEQALPASGYGGARVDQVRQNGSTTSTLTWIPTIDDHQATYKCSVLNKAMNGMAPFERELTLPVEYAPRITVGPHNPLRVLQGDKATISCDVNANPPAKGIRWLLDGHPISNHFNHTLHDVKISDAGLYSCQADNGILPPAALLLSSANAAAAGQGSGSSAASSLWGSFFGLGSASSSEANGQLKTAVEARLQLEVLYPPRVQVRPSRQPPLVEGDHFSLNCSAESWPPAHEFIWSKQEHDLVRRISASASPTLEFQSIAAGDMGNYTCTAVNRLEPSGSLSAFERQSSASALVLVRHKPGLAEILVGQNGETELGNKTLIQCRAKPPGFPEPQFKFWRYSASNGNKYYLNKQTSGATYTIFSAKAEDEAKYGCVASNELGVSNEADGELTVNEPPSIISDSARRPEDARLAGDSPYAITVRATGKPEPRVTWFHRSPVDGRRVALSSLEMMSKFRVETVSKATELHQQQAGRVRHSVVSTLTFRAPLEVEDRGLYSVEFSNGLSRSAVEDFQLHIYHSPVPMPRQQPVQVRRNARGNVVEARLKAGFNLNEVARLTCRVSAYPKPEMVWFGKDGRPLNNNSRYRTDQNNTVDDIWESTLSFTMSSLDDYDEYLCETAIVDNLVNVITENVRIFTNLSQKSAPDAPGQLEQVDASQDSVSLQWVPGFDGGFAQNLYIVQYALEDQDGGVPLSARRVAQDADQDLAGSLADGSRLFNCYTSNPCTIPNLAAKSTYLVRVKAQNELGESRFSDEVRVHTRANVSQIPSVIKGSFDPSTGVLRFDIEPSPEYLLNNVNAKIEYKSLAAAPAAASVASARAGDQSAATDGLVLDAEWRPFASVPVRQERAEINLASLQQQQPQLARVERFRLVLCSRLNEQLCGQEVEVSARGDARSFLHDQRGLSLSIVALMSSVILIALLGSFATSVHSCCLSRKAKKAAAIERADGRHHHLSANGVGADNKSSLAGHANAGLLNGAGSHKGSHGSTMTTSNESSTGAGQPNGLGQQLDLIHGHLGANLAAAANGAGGSSSDHSSDHSRQAKLDSMLPPNYNHYADRASLMLEQQQQAAYMAGKLGPPFGLAPANSATNAALMNSLSNNSQNELAGHSPLSLAANQIGYNQHHQLSSLEQQQAQNAMMFADHLQHDQTGMALNPMLSDPTNGNQSIADGHSWPAHQFTDDYNNYNTLAGYHSQLQPQPAGAASDQLAEPTYGTAASLAANASGLVMSPQSAAYDNSANSQFSQYAYGDQQQQQHDTSQYQQEIAAVQQQMYGTLTRNSGYNLQDQDQSLMDQQQQQQHLHHHQQQQQQQQQADSNDLQQQYMSSNGLIAPPPPPPPSSSVVESDYGTTRGGRLIREIIV